MEISSVDMERARTHASYAAELCRSGKLTAEQQGELTATWGADNVSKWLSVDGTKYEIDDVSYDNAKKAGKDATAESVGYDGNKNHGAWKDVANGVASAAATVGMQAVGKTVVNTLGIKTAGKFVQGSLGIVGKKAAKEGSVEVLKSTQKCVGAWVAATLAAAEATRYLTAKPNQEQVVAANHLFASELPDGQSSLNEAQGIMEEASEEVTELTEKAEDLNEEANDKIEKDKTLFDYNRQQYEGLKAKKEAGGTLTPDEQSFMKSFLETMKEAGKDIEEINNDTNDEVEDIHDSIGEYQDVYDEAGETIAEVEGVTDYAEGFDESTRTMCYVEAAGQALNATSAGVAVGQLMATNILGINTPFILLGTYAGVVSGTATYKQLEYAKQMSNEIDARRDLQELGNQTTEMYDEELDNYAGNIEVVEEDLMLEIPDDMEMPTDTTTGAETENPFAATRAGDNGENNGAQSPLTAGTGGTQSGGASQTRGVNDGNDNGGQNNDDKKKDDKV